MADTARSSALASPRLRDAMVGAAAIALGAAVLALIPSEVPGESLRAIGDMRSPAFFPALAGLVVIIAGGAIIAGSRAAAPSPAEDVPLRPWLVMLAAGAGGLAVMLLGIHAGLAAAMLATGLLLGARPVVLLPVAAGTVIVVHLMFVRLLKVVFPDPILPWPGWLLP